MSQVTIKYFRFTDPMSGNQTKGIGWEVEKESALIVIHLDPDQSGNGTVQKNEASVKTQKCYPTADDLVEITKEEYDALDTTGESMTAILRRERMTAASKKVLKQSEAVVESPLNALKRIFKIQNLKPA